jgi:hypothetical protein
VNLNTDFEVLVVMKSTLVKAFVYSTALMLFLTAAAKFVAVAGHQKVFEVRDPVLGVPFAILLSFVALFELIVATVCMLGERRELQLCLIAWLANMFLGYRIGLRWLDYHKPCPCLGNLTGALPISPGIADSVMKLVLAYLLIGSYTFLFWLRIGSRSRIVSVSTPVVPA